MAASRTYHPLDLIHIETPFVSTLKRSLKDTYCEACKESKYGLKSCSKCLAVKYCSVKCQRADWPDHKLECSHLKNLPNGDPSEDFIRMLGRVILKIKGKQWHTVKSRFLDSDVSLSEMDSHRETMAEDPFFPLFLASFKIAMRRFIGEDNMPDEYHLIELIGKMKYNMYWTEKLGMCTGCYVYIGASHLVLECIPNANYSTKNNVMKVWAIKEIKKGTEKVTVNFQDVLSSDDKSVDNVLTRHCMCLDCKYGNAVLTKILDEEKAYNVIVNSEKALKDIIHTWISKGALRTRKYLEKLLKAHDGVLGHTNLLHLRILALRCFLLDAADPESTARYLMELEKDMSMVFGEYYIEMERIYVELRNVYLSLMDIPQAAYYDNKIQRMKILKP